MLEVGMTVRVVKTVTDDDIWVGQVGILVDIQELPGAGDSYGVNFQDASRDSRIYFWDEELEVVKDATH